MVKPSAFAVLRLPVGLLLADLGVTKTHSRPHVSNDNPFSEAQFKTLKYRPGLPGAVRLDPGLRGLLPTLLPLVQHRTPSFGSRPADASRRAPQPSRAARCREGDCARHGLCRAPGTPPRRAAPPSGASGRGVDQSTPKYRALANCIGATSVSACSARRLRLACHRAFRWRARRG